MHSPRNSESEPEPVLSPFNFAGFMEQSRILRHSSKDYRSRLVHPGIAGTGCVLQLKIMRESTKKRIEMVRLELMRSLPNNVKVQLGQESLRLRTVRDTRDLVKGPSFRSQNGRATLS